MTPEQAAARAAALRKLVKVGVAVAIVVVAIGAMAWLFRDPYGFEVPSERPDLDSEDDAALSWMRFQIAKEVHQLEIQLDLEDREADRLELRMKFEEDAKKAETEKLVRRTRNHIKTSKDNWSKLEEVKIEISARDKQGGLAIREVKLTGLHVVPDGEENWKTETKEGKVSVTLTKIDGQWKVK